MSLWQKIFSRKTSGNIVQTPRRGFFARGNVVVNDDTAMKVSAYHRGLIYVSTQIAKLPWEVKDRQNNILEGDIPNLLDLAPNVEMNSFTFRCLLILDSYNYGNFYAEIERTMTGVPKAIWPLNPKDVDVLRTVSGDIVYRVRPSNGQQGKEVYLKPYDVFHIKNFHTKDGIVGQGLVAYATETLGITLAADQMASGIFNNGGVPSGVLKHPGKLSDDAYKRIKESWDEQNTGRKSGGTRILEEAMDYQTVSLQPDVLQFLESRQFGVLEVARFIGVPPTKLFDVTAATYSNVENANLEVATDTLDAWAKNIEMEADIKILNYRYGGRYTELDLYSVFRGDMKTRSDYFKSMMGIGAITPNQIRAREGMAGYGKEGDNYYIATNNFTPVNRMNEVIDAQIAGKNNQGNGNPSSNPDPNKSQGDQQLANAAIAYLSSKK